MRRGPLIAALILAALVVAGGGYAVHVRREQRMIPIIRAAVPPIPDLTTWPREYASRVRAATGAAERLQQPVKALSELACLYHANSFYREAEQAERGLNALEPDNPQWSYFLADVCRNLGDAEGAQAYLEKTFKLAPYYAPARLKLADLLLKQGRSDQAVTHYEWRLTLVPKDPYARLGLARIALQRGDRTSALKHLEAIARDNPDFPTAHNLLAEVYAQMGDPARADEQRRLSGGTGEWREVDDPWLNAMYAFGFNAYRLEVLGAIRLQPRQLGASLPFYEKAVQLAPSDGWACDALANIYLQLDRLDDARATLEAGLAAAPKTPALYATLSQMLRKQRRFSEAIAAVQRGILALPAQPALRNDLGVALEEAGRREDAVAAYREAVRLDPNLADAHYNLGLCLLALGQKHDAQASLGRALALGPSSVAALFALARGKLDAGQLEEAGVCLRVLDESRPGQPEIENLLVRWHLRQGDAAARAGRTAEAERAYRAGLALARKTNDKESAATIEKLLAQLPQ